MTEDEIREMEAGPDLDRLIALQVMGWRWARGSRTAGPSYWENEDGSFAHYADFEPSTDIAAAWQVVEKMTPIDYGFSLNIESPPGPWGNWEANFYNGSNHYAHADTVSLAICKSALLAVMDEANGR